MDWHVMLALAAAIISFSSLIPYVRDILRGTTRPNTITWGLWFFIQLIAIAAQVHEGASWSIVFVIVDGITIFVVLSFSLAGYGYRAWNIFDVWCGILGIIAIVAWQTTGSAVLALIFSVLADGLAALPTLRKAYHDAWSEHPWGWALTTVAATLGLASTTRYDPANVLFPGYLVAINGLTFLLSYIGRKTQPKPELAK
jgi:hypothetical protein